MSGALAESISGVLKGGVHGWSGAQAPALDVHSRRKLLVFGNPGYALNGRLPFPCVIQHLKTFRSDKRSGQTAEHP